MRKDIVLFGLSLALAFVVRAEKTSVFFVHGANVSEQDARVWASEMFKRLWQAGANMEFCPVAWESDIGPSYNYQANVANAFVTARRLAPLVNAVPGRRVVIAHRLFPPGDARRNLTWRGRFAAVVPVAVNFYSSGDEVLELYAGAHNPAWYNGVSPSGNWGDRYSWHKQEIWKGRKSLLGFMGTTDWSGWGFRKNAFGMRVWSAAAANAVTDSSVFATNTVFSASPESILNPSASRLETDFHLAQGIPALSPPTGRVNLWHKRIPSFDMNSSEFMANDWPRPNDGQLGGRFLHSDIKNVAYFFVHPVFRKIVEVGGLSQ